MALPIGNGAVEFAGNGKIGTLVWVFGSKLLVDLHSESGAFAGMHIACIEGVLVGEDFVRERGVGHVFLDSEVVDRKAKVKRRGHRDRRQISRAMKPGTHLI